jgi:ElaB/YqjD/DUF883 family membrane-anchored ribosome-binding protein
VIARNGSVRLGEALAQAGLPASDLARKAAAAREIADLKAEAVAGWVRARPISSVLIAAGIGFVIGKLAR